MIEGADGEATREAVGAEVREVEVGAEVRRAAHGAVAEVARPFANRARNAFRASISVELVVLTMNFLSKIVSGGTIGSRRS